MTAALVVVSLLALAFLAACAWLLRERFRLLADREIISADKRHLADLSDKLTADIRERDARERALLDRASDLASDAAALRERVLAAEQREEDEIDRRAELTEQFKTTFDALAGKALDASTTQFLKLARETFAADQEKARAELDKRQTAVDQLVKPIAETLRKTEERLTTFDRSRTASEAELKEQVRAMAEGARSLKDETGNLVKALRKPQVRGRYGEIQLQRVAELAGMRSYCDFAAQETLRDSQNAALRPDMVVKLPNGRAIAVDAKCNIEAYLDAIEADGPEKAEECLNRFAGHVADQAAALARKEYRQAIDGSVDFVVMFIPGDQFIDAAIERRPDLLDLAAEKGVIIASPSTLIGLLRAVHVGWREKSISDSANELFALGRELHERAALALEHAAGVGAAIEQARDRYNRFVGSVDGRLMPTLRKFEQKDAKSSSQVKDLRPVEGEVRSLQAAAPLMIAPISDEDPAPPEVVTRPEPSATLEPGRRS